MNGKRLKSLTRVCQALKVMKTSAETAVAATVARTERLEEERHALIATYNSHDGLQRTFAEVLSKALREIALKVAAARDKEVEQRSALRVLALRAKQAERLRLDHDGERNLERARRGLDAVIETAAQGSGKRWRSE